jgi:hypothetical protein
MVLVIMDKNNWQIDIKEKNSPIIMTVTKDIYFNLIEAIVLERYYCFYSLVATLNNTLTSLYQALLKIASSVFILAPTQMTAVYK